MLHVLPKIAWEHIKLNGAFVCHSAMRPMPIWSISFLLDWCPKYTNSTQYTARPGENNLISLMHRFLQAAAVHVCCKPQKLILFIGKAKKIESEPKSGFSTFLFIDFSKPYFITKVKAMNYPKPWTHNHQFLLNAHWSTPWIYVSAPRLFGTCKNNLLLQYWILLPSFAIQGIEDNISLALD